MPEHLLLPDRIEVPSRRQGGGGGAGLPPRNPRRHGETLESELRRAIAVGREIRVVEGIDPGLVFKVRAVANARLDDAIWERRGLTLLGETQDWTYFVFSSDDEPGELIEQLTRYEAGPDEEGGLGEGRSFFNALEHVEPYGREDRRAPELPEAPGEVAEALVVDVVLWPSVDYAEATRRLGEVRKVVGAYGASSSLMTTVLSSAWCGPG